MRRQCLPRPVSTAIPWPSGASQIWRYGKSRSKKVHSRPRGWHGPELEWRLHQIRSSGSHGSWRLISASSARLET